MSVSPPKSARSARPEILAPAGDRDCLRAAVENGADAVYFGLSDGFNARARATNFALADLEEVFAELHRRGVKGYVAFNTLVFESELEAAALRLRRLVEAGADAIIVQDVGVARLAREICPGLPLHASTQMTISTAAGCEFAKRQGIERAILARELSVADVAAIHAETDLELEVFVHGALCVSWSGQCLTSEVWGGRSANRGECAQACRMPYTLEVDGAHRELGAMRYLLSPKDLAAFDLLPELVDAGVVSFKIEGRLKTPEYVANVTATYRKALDQALAKRKVTLAPQEVRDLEQSFSRGLSHGFLGGVNHQQLVEGRNPKKRGVFLGWVADVDPRARVATVALVAPLKRGDGVVFEGPDPERGEEGGPVFDLRVGGRRADGEVAPPAGAARAGEDAAAPYLVDFVFGRERGPDLAQVEAGTRVFKTKDPELDARLRATFDGGGEARRRAPVTLRVRGAAGGPLAIEARDELGHAVSVQSEIALQAARNRPLTAETLREQLARLGGTIFRLASGAAALVVELEGAVMLPLSELSRLRREFVERLSAARAAAPSRELREGDALARLRAPARPAAPEALAAPHRDGFELSVLARDDAQVEAALDAGVDRIYLDYLDLVGLGRAVERIRARGRRAIPATTRIAKPGDERILESLLGLGGAGLLARHLGAVEEVVARRAAEKDHLDGPQVARALELVGDFSLNAANGLSARTLLERGLDLLTPSHDLDAEQLLALLAGAPAERIEVVVHHHLPLFHMEHCVFAHLLSNGADYRSCGRPCERHAIGLKDDKGWVHPVLADVGCRNTLFNHRPQSAAEWLPRFRAAGLARFRVELLRETREQAREVVELYRRALRGALAPRELFRTLNAEGRFGVVGVTRGTLPPGMLPVVAQ